MKKGLVFSILLSVILLFIPQNIYADESNNEDLKRVVDYADLLTDSQEEKLEKSIKEVRDKYNQDIVFVFTDDLGGQEIEAYADDFFDYNGYGYGPDSSGILFVVDMNRRETYISTCGESISTFTDYGCDYVLDKVTKHLGDGNYNGAVNEFKKLCEDFMEQYTTGEPYDYNNPVGGKRKNIIGIIIGEIVVLLSGLIGATSKTSAQVASMNRVQNVVRASNYLADSKPEITVSDSTLISTHVVKHAISTSSSSSGYRGGSTTHRSSSGRSHGGSTHRGHF